jgi:holliday junction DNA helicase RuvA
MTAGGLGYELYMSSSNLMSLAGVERGLFFTHLAVKDDALDLYGFLAKQELFLFKLLISVSGVGPKTAMLILNAGAEQVTRAITTADVSFFTAIPKVGKKNAQKIIIELKNKIGSVAELDLTGDGMSETDELLSALTGMGFDRRELLVVMRTIPSDVVTIEDKIRYVLKTKSV